MCNLCTYRHNNKPHNQITTNKPSSAISHAKQLAPKGKRPVFAPPPPYPRKQAKHFATPPHNTRAKRGGDARIYSAFIIHALYPVVSLNYAVSRENPNGQTFYRFNHKDSSSLRSNGMTEMGAAHSDSDNRVIAILFFPHFDTASCFDLFKEKERGPV
ncbi:MAG: hypothetical protein LBQ18_06780 [Campylobacteraceae bacterium]|jgi:hypothetical protein|nr:hypothetical protein [Campylobacteraceae bacterium]